MKAASSAFVLLGLALVPLRLSAHPPVKATPLIEIEGRGIRFTDVQIPLCGHTCRNLDPRFLSYRVAIMTSGLVAGTLTDNKLDDQSGSATSVFQGTATLAQMATLRSLLLDARIGIVQGGCTVGFIEIVAGEPNPTFHGYDLSYSVLWYGKANRLNFFTLPQGASPCDPSLRNLIKHILSVARQVERRSSSG